MQGPGWNLENTMETALVASGRSFLRYLGDVSIASGQREGWEQAMDGLRHERQGYLLLQQPLLCLRRRSDGVLEGSEQVNGWMARNMARRVVEMML